LHGRFIMKRINHQEAYSLDGACTNDAESSGTITTLAVRISSGSRKRWHGARITGKTRTVFQVEALWLLLCGTNLQ
jgi:hypothetical protein